jgi:signal transduction histidine kinase/ligand-binding sensor domain-containing protein
MLVACATHALDPNLQLSQLNHRNWVVRDYAPSDVTAIAQTKDGALWLGTSGLLYWTDGISFEPHATGGGFELPSTNISALRAAEDGSLWVGFEFGGVARLLKRDLKEYGEREGLPAGTVHTIAQDADGLMWVATSRGLARLVGDRWQQMDEALGWPSGPALCAFVDRAGTLWVATPDRVLKLPARQQRFQTVVELRTRIAGASLAQAPDGAMWLSAFGIGVTQVRERDVPKWREDRQAGQILFDRDGNLWMAGEGLKRLSPSGQLEEFSRAQGLSSNSVHALLEDREGNVWVGTTAGLDRLTHSDFVRTTLPWSPGHTALAAAEDGSIWMGSGNARSVLKFVDGRQVQQLDAPPFTAATRAHDGVIWFGGPEAIARVVNDRLELFAFPDAAKGKEVDAIVVDGRGAVWAAFDELSLFQFSDGTWTPYGNIAELPRGEVVSATVDEHGDVWFGYLDHRVARVSGDRVQVYTAADGLDVGAVTALHAKSSWVWAGGDHGTAIFDGKHFATVRAANCQPFIAVSGIVETNTGDVWIFRGTALSSIEKARDQLTADNTQRRLDCTTYGRIEGLPGSSQQRPAPSLVQSTDGRLWMAASDGVAWLNPDHMRRPQGPPPATILTLREGMQRYDAEADYIRLPIHTQNIRIAFTAWSLTNPEQVRFRYRLEGLDSDWQVVGRQREAIYTNLGPGTYRFRVAASHDNVTWNEAQAPLEFAILPAFYQTTWFKSVCAGIALVLLVFLYRLQVRRATFRLRVRLEERISERERIARELHDTLLQGVQGLIMRFQSVALRIPEREPLRGLMESALDRADQVLIESRDKVKDLRDVSGSGIDLSQEIAEAGQLLADGGSTEFSVTVNGSARSLHQIVREETFLIAREAMSNAFKHARAERIEVELSYQRSALRVHIRDDGAGIDTATLQAGGRADHWGLLGMRERAKRMGAHLQIYSRSNAGTEIELRVPASVAYSDRRSARRRSLRTH